MGQYSWSLLKNIPFNKLYRSHSVHWYIQHTLSKSVFMIQQPRRGFPRSGQWSQVAELVLLCIRYIFHHIAGKWLCICTASSAPQQWQAALQHHKRQLLLKPGKTTDFLPHVVFLTALLFLELSSRVLIPFHAFPVLLLNSKIRGKFCSSTQEIKCFSFLMMTLKEIRQNQMFVNQNRALNS